MPRPHLRDPKLERFWRATLAAWAASGLNIRAFCREHRLTEPSFYAWRREITARDAAPAPATSPRRTSTRPRVAPGRGPALVPRPNFVGLRVVPDTPLELLLRSGQVLLVPPGYDATQLRAVVPALEATPC